MPPRDRVPSLATAAFADTLSTVTQRASHPTLAMVSTLPVSADVDEIGASWLMTLVCHSVGRGSTDVRKLLPCAPVWDMTLALSDSETKDFTHSMLVLECGSGLPGLLGGSLKEGSAFKANTQASELLVEERTRVLFEASSVSESRSRLLEIAATCRKEIDDGSAASPEAALLARWSMSTIELVSSLIAERTGTMGDSLSCLTESYRMAQNVSLHCGRIISRTVAAPTFAAKLISTTLLQHARTRRLECLYRMSTLHARTGDRRKALAYSESMYEVAGGPVDIPPIAELGQRIMNPDNGWWERLVDRYHLLVAAATMPLDNARRELEGSADTIAKSLTHRKGTDRIIEGFSGTCVLDYDGHGPALTYSTQWLSPQLETPQALHRLLFMEHSSTHDCPWVRWLIPKFHHSRVRSRPTADLLFRKW